MTPEKYARLATEGFNHIPVTRELFADLDTPLSCYIKVARGPYSYLLESAAQGGEKWARFSVVGLPSSQILKISGNCFTREINGEVVEQRLSEDPLGDIEEFQSRFRYPDLPGLPNYTGGLVGYFGYDTIRYVEKKLRYTEPPDNIGCPDILLMVSNDLIVFDSLKAKIHIISHAATDDPDALDKAEARLDQMQHAMQGEVPSFIRNPARGPNIHESDFVSSYGKTRFMHDVEKIRDYIVEGDVMQVVLSQRMSVTFENDPLHLYRALRTLNPSPYMYFMDLDDCQIVSSSPEILARLDSGEVTVRPLAGTRRRGRDAADDLAMEQELQSDSKEIAEHLMLIDLGRNDIGKVCDPGSVEVTEMMTIEHYAHVMHIASNVRGRVQPAVTGINLLRATLPVGTLSGAPKIRAMEIIDEFETEKRGIFGGAVGYLSWNGNMDTAIAIRTAIIKDNKLYIQAGAGVVADSVPELEWKETMNKARSIFLAAAMAESGLEVEYGTAENTREYNREESREIVGQAAGGGD